MRMPPDGADPADARRSGRMCAILEDMDAAGWIVTAALAVAGLTAGVLVNDARGPGPAGREPAAAGRAVCRLRVTSRPG